MPPAIATPRICVLLLLALVARPGSAGILTVGAGGSREGCDATDVQRAIDLAANRPGEDEVRLTVDPVASVALSIGAQALVLRGGYASCIEARRPEARPVASTILSGAGGVAAPVLTLTGTAPRTLSNLQVRDGDNLRACGGGIRFVGAGVLQLEAVGLANNRARDGGGLCASARDGVATVQFGTDVVVSGNLATSGHGGGVHLDGATRLEALADRTTILLNRAPGGYGGGLFARAPAQFDVGSPGFGGIGVLYGNSARRGGGVAFVVGGDAWPLNCSRLFSTSPLRPVRVHDNQASEVGGGLYLESGDVAPGIGTIGVKAVARIDGSALHLTGNRAPNGPAAFLGGSSDTLTTEPVGSVLNINPPPFVSCFGPVESSGAFGCVGRTPCSLVEGNQAIDATGAPAAGNVIELRDGSRVDLRQLRLSGNTGKRLLSTSGDGRLAVELASCAAVGNALDTELFRAFSSTRFVLRDCTVAGNAIAGRALLSFDVDSTVELRRDVIVQPRLTTLSRGLGTVATAGDVVSAELASLPAAPSVVNVPARFVDPETGDFRLRAGAYAVDAAPTPSLPEPEDVDGRPRDVDLGLAVVRRGPRDLGGYERQPDDPWLLNGSFADGLRLWAAADAATVRWDETRTAPGDPGGSVVLEVPVAQAPPGSRHTALVQCFNLPGGGRFAITALAQVSPALANRDFPAVRWRLRYADGDCGGAVDAEGVHALGRSGSTWQGPLAPIVVDVDPQRWGWDSTLEIRLEAAQDPASPSANSLFARFDAVQVARAVP